MMSVIVVILLLTGLAMGLSAFVMGAIAACIGEPEPIPPKRYHIPPYFWGRKFGYFLNEPRENKDE